MAMVNGASADSKTMEGSCVSSTVNTVKVFFYGQVTPSF